MKQRIATLPTIQWSINLQSNLTTKYSPNELKFNSNFWDVRENRVNQALQDEYGLTDEVPINAKRQNGEKSKWKERYQHKDQLVVINHLPSGRVKHISLKI